MNVKKNQRFFFFFSLLVVMVVEPLGYIRNEYIKNARTRTTTTTNSVMKWHSMQFNRHTKDLTNENEKLLKNELESCFFLRRKWQTPT